MFDLFLNEFEGNFTLSYVQRKSCVQVKKNEVSFIKFAKLVQLL